ncbi:thiosulfate dehydrogenase [quinone] large subunit [Oikeobacillus pervagus]|uniref:Thiosulfate dehydrogenase [quinone] large subunit n=1 Tax=Oikeobacillus pervagus TaxID=1325931 RepID=A0AAJ1SY12_9BACI|nr:DoxX family protein [Oikeobacillus pervagus]MDQ0214924.1 thiosulfate dehydrogenase [quinone] large subunit [Oikeobacillus pervagus]
MFIHFLRENTKISILLAVLRVYLGYTWMTAGWGKIAGGQFDASGFLQGAVAKATGEHPAVQGWWAAFLENIAIQNVEIFNTLVPWGEFLVGIGLLLGCFTKSAVFFGLMMNFSYLFSGTTSTNPQLVLLSMFILISAKNAGKYGIDGLVMPSLKGKQFVNKTRKEMDAV